MDTACDIRKLVDMLVLKQLGASWLQLRPCHAVVRQPQPGFESSLRKQWFRHTEGVPVDMTALHCNRLLSSTCWLRPQQQLSEAHRFAGADLQVAHPLQLTHIAQDAAAQHHAAA